MLIELSNPVDLSDDTRPILPNSNFLLEDSEPLQLDFCDFFVLSLFLTCKQQLLSVALTTKRIFMASGTLFRVLIEIIASSVSLARSVMNIRVARGYLATV